MVIRSWLTRWPDALIGMPTGKRTRTVVVDVDRKNGKDGFASLEERSIELPVTRANPTLSEGEHHIYSYPDGVDKVTSRNDVLSGVDGGYIILHGNLRPEDLKGLTPYPQELASALSPRKRMNGPGSQSSTTSRPTAFSVSPEAMEMELNRAVEMLNFIDCDPFDNWNNVGFWLRGHFGERGRTLWAEWSKRSNKFNQSAQDRQWLTFAKARPGLGPLVDLAKAGGYRPGRVNGVHHEPKAGGHADDGTVMPTDKIEIKFSKGECPRVVSESLDAIRCSGEFYQRGNEFVRICDGKAIAVTEPYLDDC